MDLYFQKIGVPRVVAVIGWSSKDVLVEDLLTGLEYPISWDIFFRFHEEIEEYDADIDRYDGPNLTI